MNYTQNGINAIKSRQFEEAFGLLNEGFFYEGESKSGCYLAQMYFDVKITPRTEESLYKAMMLWYSTIDTTPSSKHKLGVNLYASKNSFAKEKGLTLIKEAAEEGYTISYGFLGVIAYKNGMYDSACNYFQKYGETDKKITMMYAEALSKKRNPDIELAEKLFLVCAEEFGQTQAYIKLAEIYKDPSNTDLKKMLIYLMKATDLGDLDSCATLVEILGVIDDDLTVICDLQEDNNSLILKYFTKAVDLGIPMGAVGLGDLYANGKGVTKNTEHALTLYNKAQNMGYDACKQKGLLYYNNGEFDRAYFELKKYYENGNEDLIYQLFYSAYVLENISDVINDYIIKIALKCEEKCLLTEEVCFILGKAYYFENNIVRKDNEKAMSYFAKCPDIPGAAYIVGCMGAYGETNVISPSEAESYLLKASEYNIVDAMLVLGKLYAKWNLYTKAINILMKAYNNGSKEAAFEISQMYRDGYVTGRKDKKRAKEWEIKAQG